MEETAGDPACPRACRGPVQATTEETRQLLFHSVNSAATSASSTRAGAAGTNGASMDPLFGLQDQDCFPLDAPGLSPLFATVAQRQKCLTFPCEAHCYALYSPFGYDAVQQPGPLDGPLVDPTPAVPQQPQPQQQQLLPAPHQLYGTRQGLPGMLPAAKRARREQHLTFHTHHTTRVP